jgi:hypothetical protein
MKKLFALLVAFTALLGFPAKAQAVCPICTVAVGAGLGISRWLGIDDSVTGLWIGGLILSSGLWLADWIGKRNWKVPQKELLSVSLFFVMVIPPLYWGKLIGLPGNLLWGIDKVLLGIAIGSLLFISGVWLDKWLRSANENKVYVYYQKVIIPVFLLSIASFIFYLITN